MPQPFVPALNVVKCELIFTSNGQRVENVFHVLSGDAVNIASLDRIQAKLLSWYNASLKPQISSAVTLVLMRLSDQTSQFAIGKEYTLSVAGTATGTLQPNNVTIAVKHTTTFRGRSYRGRSYHVGITAGMVTGNQLLSTNVTVLAAAYNALRTALAAAPSPVDTFVIVSRRQNLVWLTTAVITPVTNSSVEANLDSQRRRLTGPGRGN